MKVMSIVGIVWFSLSLVFVIAFYNEVDIESAIGWGLLGMLYAIPVCVCVVGLINSNKKNQQLIKLAELRELGELKEKGVLSEDGLTIHCNKNKI